MWQEGEEDHFQVAVASADELAAYCLVCKLEQHETGRMQIGRAGEFLYELFKPAQQLDAQRSRVRALAEGHPDLCVSETASYVTLRRGWPNRTLPTSDDEIESEDEVQCDDLDMEFEDTFVNQNLEKQAPVNITLLQEAASRYLVRRVGLKKCKGGLGKKPCESDARSLAEKFNQSVRDHGILRLEVILAEIDHACNVRKISEDTGHKLPFRVSEKIYDSRCFYLSGSFYRDVRPDNFE